MRGCPHYPDCGCGTQSGPHTCEWRPGADILALDIATNCGWARGHIHGVPAAGSISFGKANASANAVFANGLKWIADLLDPRPRPDVVIVEAMLPPDAKVGNTSRATRDRLAGLHAIVRAVAYLRTIPEIKEATVGDVRDHFLGTRTMKSRAAKAETVTRCLQLGWPATDEDAADALALWSYARSLIDPQYALVVSPLFNKSLRVRVQI
jgi:hypothetical protein